MFQARKDFHLDGRLVPCGALFNPGDVSPQKLGALLVARLLVYAAPVKKPVAAKKQTIRKLIVKKESA